MHRDDEVTLQELENAAVQHLDWLRQVHAALLFGGEAPEPIGVPQVLADWVEAPEGSPTVAAERCRAFHAVKESRRHLVRHAARLAGGGVDADAYQSFMAAVERFAGDLRRLEKMLRQSMAETDPLTGVHNRLGMTRDLDREWQRSLRTGQPCCVALVDLDHFKRINDTFGHPAGDKVLSMAARFFVRRLRPYDRVYRYGGEEFLFILPNTDLETAERVLDRLRGLMARLPIRLKDGQILRVTASIGVAEMATRGDAPATALARADRAVYAAKHAGRNRVCVDAPAETDLPEMPAAAIAQAAAERLHG